MDEQILSFLLPLGTSALISFFVTPIVIKIAGKLKIIDDPKSHVHPKVVHTKAVPRGGGLVIFLALAISSLIFLPKVTWLLGVLLGAGILAVTGFLDDRYEEQVSPRVRLFLNAAAALCVVGVGIGIAFVTNPFGGVINLDTWRYCFPLWDSIHCVNIIADAFALVWLIGMQNIVGWSSGVDGQLSGFVIVAALVMAALSVPGSFGYLLAAVAAGAFLGFLPWNWWPQKIMPGYGGKSLAGFLLGVLAIVSSAKVGALVLVLGIPFVDAALVILKRLREGRSPLMGGREHLHHYLLDLGWSKRKIAGFYTMVAIGLGLLALRLQPPAKFFTIAGVILFIAAAILWLRKWSTYSKQPDRDSG